MLPKLDDYVIKKPRKRRDESHVNIIQDPVILYFSERLRDLTQHRFVQHIDKRRGPRKVTPLTVYKMLVQHAPNTAPSKTQVYRYFHGQAAPTIVTVNDFARLFNVSPRSFLPETAEGPAVHPTAET